MYETYLRHLFRLRAEYWQMESSALRNLKLSQMVLLANACGKNLMDFLLEEAPEKSTSIAKNEQKATVKAETKAKTMVLLQSPSADTTMTAKKAKSYQCPSCDFTTDSPKALSGHMKRHSSKYQSLKIETRLPTPD